jgi:hypothetical protein
VSDVVPALLRREHFMDCSKERLDLFHRPQLGSPQLAFTVDPE